MAISVNMIYDDDTTRKSAITCVCINIYICVYVCICIITTIHFCGIRHVHFRPKNAFTVGLYYIL